MRLAAVQRWGHAHLSQGLSHQLDDRWGSQRYGRGEISNEFLSASLYFNGRKKVFQKRGW